MDNLLFLLGPSLVLLLLQFFFPYKPSKSLTVFDITRNKLRYDKLENMAVFVVIPSLLVIGFSIYLFGVQATDKLFPSSYFYIHKVPKPYWGFLAIVLSIGLVRVPVVFIYKMILKDEYYIFNEYSSLKHGFNGEKMWRLVEMILVVGGLFVFMLGLNWYTRIDKHNQTIEINELFSFKTHTYKLSDVKEITYYPEKIASENSKKVKEYYSVKMNDGFIWNSKTYCFFTDIKDDYTKLATNIKKLSDLTKVDVYRFVDEQ